MVKKRGKKMCEKEKEKEESERRHPAHARVGTCAGCPRDIQLLFSYEAILV